jgi:hypothetical protein
MGQYLNYEFLHTLLLSTLRYTHCLPYHLLDAGHNTDSPKLKHSLAHPNSVFQLPALACYITKARDLCYDILLGIPPCS